MASNQEKRWLEEYLQCWNATEAARRVGYQWPGKVGPAKAAKFADEIRARLDAMVMSADEALIRLSEIARGEWSHYVTRDGTVDIAKLVEDGKAHLISEIRDTKEGRQYRFCDMQAALVKIGDHHGLFPNRHEHMGKDGEPITLRVVWEKDGLRDTPEDAA